MYLLINYYRILCAFKMKPLSLWVSSFLYIGTSTFIDQNPINLLKNKYSWISPTKGLNEVRPAVYRAALKLRSLQKLCQSKFFCVELFL